jgi:tRNA A37 methylthiotransferase MiaB
MYADGSHLRGNPTLGARVINPRANNLTHIGTNPKSEIHTASREELAVITAIFRQNYTEDHLQLLMDSSLCINAIISDTIDPSSYNHHLHRSLQHQTDQLLKAMDHKHLQTSMGEVKSYTYITYNDT